VLHLVDSSSSFGFRFVLTCCYFKLTWFPAATSALDAETEASIIDTLVNLRDNDGLTLVSVSHHPSTAVKADKIVVMRAGGTVAEEGVYDDLVSREGGLFKRMVEAGE